MPMVATVIIRTRRAPSPQIRARDTSNDGAPNGSAGVNSAPDADAGVNGAPDLGEHRRRDHDHRGDSTIIERLPSISLGLPWLPLPLPFKWPNIIGLGSGQGPAAPIRQERT